MPHTLNVSDQWFLAMRRKDPLTGGQFQIGDSVVVCRQCRTVHLSDTWFFEHTGCKVQGCGSTSYSDNFNRDTVVFSSVSIKKSTTSADAQNRWQQSTQKTSTTHSSDSQQQPNRNVGLWNNWGWIPTIALVILVIAMLSQSLQGSRNSTPQNTQNSTTSVMENGQDFNDIDAVLPDDYIVSDPTTEPVVEDPSEKELSTTPTEVVITGLHIPECNRSEYYFDDIESSSITIDSAVINRFSYQFSEDGQQIRHQFTIPRDGRYLVAVEDMNNDMVLEAEVRDSSGNMVDSDSYFINNDSFTLKGLEEGDTYTLVLDQDVGLGSFTVIVGNQKPHVTATSYTHINDSVEYLDQRNVYSFTVPRSGRYRFELNDMESRVVTELLVFDANGNTIDSDTYAVDGDGLTLKGLNAGEKYQIQVRQNEGYSDYTLFIGYQKEIVDVSGYTDLFDSVQYQDQRNVYLYTIPISGRYRVQLDGMTSNAVMELYVFDSNGDTVASDTYAVNGDGLTLKGLNAGEEYQIQVRQNAGFSDYALSLGCQKPTNTVEVDTDVYDSIEYFDQRNVYDLYAETNDPITVTVAEMRSNCVVELYVFDASGDTLVSDTHCINHDSVTFTPVTGELYQIQVRYCAGYSPYVLTLR